MDDQPNANSDDPQARIQAAREIFSGRTLTEGQFKEAWAVSGIIHGEIHKTGSFREKLTDYAHAFARSERFDALRGETILRDIYQGRYGQTMNQTRAGLIEREKTVTETARLAALDHAEKVGKLIQEGATLPFYKAYDVAATTLARRLGSTQSHAKALMKEVYKATCDRDLYEVGKEIEEAYHKPVREAEIATRKAGKLENHSQSQSMA